MDNIVFRQYKSYTVNALQKYCYIRNQLRNKAGQCMIIFTCVLCVRDLLDHLEE